MEVHVLDRVTTGPKPALVHQLGVVYHTGTVTDLGLRPDIVIECTGVVPLILQAAEAVAPGGIVCLTGIGPPPAAMSSRPAGLANDAVLKNLVIFGSVNAIAATTTGRPRHWPKRTGPGWNSSSRAVFTRMPSTRP
jgi:threonine dehydrogenase-like Zn-dependent dehydrogenase